MSRAELGLRLQALHRADPGDNGVMRIEVIARRIKGGRIGHMVMAETTSGFVGSLAGPVSEGEAEAIAHDAFMWAWN